MPPINLLNYSIMRDWFDNSLWLKQHSKETENRVENKPVDKTKLIKTILNKR